MREIALRWTGPSTVTLHVCGDDAATHGPFGHCDDDLGPLGFVRRPLRVVDPDSGLEVLDDDGQAMTVAEPSSRLEAHAHQQMEMALQQRASDREVVRLQAAQEQTRADEAARSTPVELVADGVRAL